MKQVKQEHYTKEYKNPYYGNAGTILLFKSMRKNAQCIDLINIVHLIPAAGMERIEDDRITEQLLNVLEKVIVYSTEKTGGKIYIKTFIQFNKRSSYVNANGDNYNDHETLKLTLDRKQIYSWEVLKYLYAIFSLIYPYNSINLNNELWHNKRLDALLKKLY